MSIENESADPNAAKVAKELGEEGKPILGNKKDFLTGPGSKFLSKRVEQPKPEEPPVASVEPKPGETKPPVEPAVSHKPNQKNVIKQTFRKAEELEAQNSELTKKLGEVEPKLTAAEKKAADLEAKLATAKSEEEYTAIAQKLKKAEESVADIIKDRDEKAMTLKIINVRADPQFQEDYIIPVQKTRGLLEKMANGVEDAMPALQRAFAAHKAIYESATQEERDRHEQIRDSMFYEAVSNLPEHAKDKFKFAISKYTEQSEELNQALIDSQRIGEEYQRSRQQAAIEAQNQILQNWTGAMKETAKAVSDFEGLTEDEIIIAKELELDYDKEDDDKIAKAIIDPNVNVSEKDATRILNQGRVHKVLVSKLKVREKQIADLKEILEGYRGSSQERGGGGGLPSLTRQAPLEEKKAAFIGRFAPGRR